MINFDIEIFSILIAYLLSIITVFLVYNTFVVKKKNRSNLLSDVDARLNKLDNNFRLIEKRLKALEANQNDGSSSASTHSSFQQLQEELEKLKKSFSEMQEKTSKLTPSKNLVPSFEKLTDRELQPYLQNAFIKLYFSGPAPHKQAFDNNQAKSTYEPSVIVYEFILLNDTQAVFQIYQSPEAFEIATKRRKDILPAYVCEIKGTNGNKIRNLKLGKAKLEDNLWKIIQKLEIEFHN